MYIKLKKNIALINFLLVYALTFLAIYIIIDIIIQTGEPMDDIGDKEARTLFSMMTLNARKLISTLSYQIKKNRLSSAGLPTGIPNTLCDTLYTIQYIGDSSVQKEFTHGNAEGEKSRNFIPYFLG